MGDNSYVKRHRTTVRHPRMVVRGERGVECADHVEPEDVAVTCVCGWRGRIRDLVNPSWGESGVTGESLGAGFPVCPCCKGEQLKREEAS